ncbi:response regulator transcription factor [Rhodopseudomonas boonkerdii]|uniref:response regulator transcription factor n=1 Tax=Rhodopseudomonas boonkerdii TaxID=475937 RepID=UPI0024C0D96D|nr:response regulator transcription factor [Rhodopseudomonas boonkerdii]UGV25740.1 response regulator transcription factor [Rhodopseudomonas boonkerdii]
MISTTILCIEDNPEISELIVEVLEDEGFAVSVVANGADALAALQPPPDLVLCDLDLPGLSGFEILERARGEGILPLTVPFIFITAYAQRSNQLQARGLGCDDFVSKPIDFEMLVPIIRHRLALARVRAPVKPAFALTERESETLTWVARGKSSPAIATILGVTERTVQFHVNNVIQKTGAATRAQAAAQCAILGIIKP